MNKKNFLLGFLFVICVFAVVEGNAQTNTSKVVCTGENVCPRGVYGQWIEADMNLSEQYYGLHVDLEKKKSDRWTLDVLDEVYPTYKFEIDSVNESTKPFAVVGRLVSPVGKLFEFRQATYDISTRKLNFTTAERDGISYVGEIQFHPKPVFIKGVFEEGTVKLTASGKMLGEVKMSFGIADLAHE